MLKKMLRKTINLIKGTGSMIGKFSLKIAVVMGILAAISLIGLITSIELLNKEYENYDSRVYEDLKSILNDVSAGKGITDKAKALIEAVQGAHPELMVTIITKSTGEIVYSPMELKMKKFFLYSDIGGFNYVFDENNTLRYVVFGKYGSENMVRMQKYYDLYQSYLYTNYLLSAPYNIGKYFTGGNNGYIGDGGRFEITTPVNFKFEMLPYDVITVKPKQDDYYLYAFKYPGSNFGEDAIGFFEEMRWSGPISTVDSYISSNPWTNGEWVKVPKIMTYEILREVFLAALIISAIIGWMFLSLWVFRDARKRKLNPLPWTALILLTNVIGLVVYLTVRPKYVKCKNCGMEIPKVYVSCPHCGSTEKEKCLGCGTVLEEEFLHCPACGKER